MKYMELFGVMAAMTMASTPAAAQNTGPNNTTEYETRDNGGYFVESKSDMTTSGGTVKTGEHSVDVKVDDEGRVTKKATTRSSQDTEGLMNQKTQVKDMEYEEKSDGSYVEKKVIKQKDADGTNVKTKVKTDVDVKSDGTREKTVERTKVTDPKGLMNKTKETVKTVNGKVVD